MAKVKVICDETRYVGSDRYIQGATYEMDAERAGKYRQSFRPVTDSDRVEAEAAWNARMAQVQEEIDTRRYLYEQVDPSLVKAAVMAIQGEIAKAAQSKVAARGAAA